MRSMRTISGEEGVMADPRGGFMVKYWEEIPCPPSSMDRAPDFESVGWEFESPGGRTDVPGKAAVDPIYAVYSRLLV